MLLSAFCVEKCFRNFTNKLNFDFLKWPLEIVKPGGTIGQTIEDIMPVCKAISYSIKSISGSEYDLKS